MPPNDFAKLPGAPAELSMNGLDHAVMDLLATFGCIPRKLIVTCLAFHDNTEISNMVLNDTAADADLALADSDAVLAHLGAYKTPEDCQNLAQYLHCSWRTAAGVIHAGGGALDMLVVEAWG